MALVKRRNQVYLDILKGYLALAGAFYGGVFFLDLGQTAFIAMLVVGIFLSWYLLSGAIIEDRRYLEFRGRDLGLFFGELPLWFPFLLCPVYLLGREISLYNPP